MVAHTDLAVLAGLVAQAPVQPSANPTRTRPCASIVASIKSSKLRHGLVPPPSQMQPRCTGSFVALTVVQVLPPSYVCATYKSQTPLKLASWNGPAAEVPWNANAARSGSPATTAGKTEF